MEVTLVGGATVDIATNEDIQRHHDWLKNQFDGKPEGDYIPLFGSITAPVSPTTIAFPLEPKKPAAGKMWSLQWVSLFTTGFGGVIASVTAAVCVGNVPRGPANNVNVNPSEIVYPANSFPIVINIPTKVLVRPSEQVYVLLNGSGLVAGTVYVATGAAIETDLTREMVIAI